MVLSACTAYDLDNGYPAYSMFEKQLAGAVVGLVLMWLAAKSSPRLFRVATLLNPLLERVNDRWTEQVLFHRRGARDEDGVDAVVTVPLVG